MRYIPAGAVSSSQDPVVGDQGAGTEPATGIGGEGQGTGVWELASGGGFTIGDTTFQSSWDDQVLRVDGGLGDGASRHGGQNQSEGYENFHVGSVSEQLIEELRPIKAYIGNLRPKQMFFGDDMGDSQVQWTC